MARVVSLRHAVLTLTLILWLALPPLAPAPIFGGYPGLDGLLRSSSQVVVGEITLPTADRRVVMGVPYRDHVVTVRRTIVGTLREGESHVIGIRPLPFLDLRSGLPASPEGNIRPVRSLQASSFAEGRQYLLFLQTDPPFSPYEPHGTPAVAFTLNCSGSHIPLAPGTDLFPGLDASPEVIVERIICDSTARLPSGGQRAQAEELERVLLGE